MTDAASDDSDQADDSDQVFTVAATADVHCNSEHRDELAAALGDVDRAADLLLLAGDLTNYGEPQEAAELAGILRSLDLPTVAVLGNHDWHTGHSGEVIDELARAGVHVLGGEAVSVQLCGGSVGVAGTKGFVGGFAGSSHLPDFGEPALRDLYRVGTQEVEALERGLREVELCPLRIVLLHYSPTADTLVGEPPGIWTFLGSDRLAAPILQHEPDLVVHGHAHAGTVKGAVAGVPVYNVSMALTGRGYCTFELRARQRTSATIR